ncbi:hypothetical protein Q4F19_11035 [Sphingomonas sp. BIUV-7]|uniref:Uncharacterized protein n=1 Tax=Sphingomonas natans TaxID=3063330 RepID=A0ABT8Y9A3_9SPHN|nr:hypothetical protein [Sphingomonas sp. BIUV-7]MDO6414916.1 hypothetical protein [Sphingomonas sp. BIUV-7]
MPTALAFANDVQPALSSARPHLRLVEAAPGLTAGERQAVEIGRDDAFRHGWDAGLADRTPGRRLVAAIARWLGIQGVMPLADPRLERLRLFAAMMRRDDRRVHAMADLLRQDGINPAALHQAIALALA